jgi:nucleotide-binding universal stress UspA family protein
VTDEDLQRARDAIRTRLSASLSGARLDAGGELEAFVVAAARHPAQLVLERAAVEEANLIVLGRHRRHGILGLGSTARGVLAGAPCPVWVQAGPVRVVRRILVPVDLSEESLAALGTACTWGERFGAEIIVLHCFQTPELFAGHGYPVPGPPYVVEQLGNDAKSEFEKVMEGVDWKGVPHETRFVEDHPAHQILALQDDVDLVMMGSHGRTGLSGALLGNIALSVIRDGHVPVLALRDPERKWIL